MCLIAVAALLASCTTERVTRPGSSATEQLLISRAVDRAVSGIALPAVDGRSVYLNAAGIEGLFAGYAAAALREKILLEGGRLAADRGAADVVVDARAGVLSVDEFETLIGLPSYDLPIPLAGDVTTPEAALYKRAERRGIAKLALAAYDGKTGNLLAAQGPNYGFSQKREWTVMFFVSWENNDLIPPGVAPSRNSIAPPS